ncbi:uncharacterized protein [Bemisia tabaci]|uniref:uncharacterized protein isoform X2 n=1 Tax=Bemisia tabaci TaxID=7038 RepID=UPI0008F9B2F6|nr:PREDICTED: uncharacterized protein LOC109038690 isoform X2 [Bemisia tabaci]
MAQLTGMSHSLLISLVIVCTCLSSLVKAEEELKQAPAFTDSEKPFKLGELLQRLQAAKQALDRERIIEQASKDGKDLFEYLGENYYGSDSSDTPIAPPGYRVRLISTPEAARDDYLYGKDKRGNYMTLCHFKICNMGRKRWKSWP